VNEEIYLCLAGVRKYLAKVGWLLLIAEALLGLIAGGFISNWINTGEYPCHTAFLTLAFIILLILDAYAKKLFPSAIIGDLENRLRLRDCKGELDRRDELFRQLDISVQRLNEQTCSISQTQAEQIVSEPVKRSLSRLIAPIIETPNYVFACKSNEYSVIARVGHDDFDKYGVKYRKYFISFRDDLDLFGIISENEQGKDTFEDLESTGLRKIIGGIMRSSFYENRYIIDRESNEADNDYTFIVAPIPLICEDTSAGGVLFIATNTKLDCPGDIPNVLQTYGRLMANWLSRYDEFVDESNDTSSITCASS